MRAPLAIAFTAAALLGCQSAPDDAPRATAALKPLGTNKTFGEATFDQVGNKVRVVAYVQGLAPTASTASTSTRSATATRPTA